ncbi:hypothetical protein D3C76_1693550 [compost metagenome]
MGVIPIKIPLSPVCTGIQMLDPIAAPARSAGLAWPDIIVSKKVINDIVTCVTRMGIRILRN